MKKDSIRFILSLVVITSLLGCNDMKSISNDRKDNAVANGGGSDGGGNTYQGKPLESYAKKPEELKSFQNYIAPILKDLESKHVDSADGDRLDVLKNLISSIYTQKVWYFVPGPLAHIPIELLNSAVKTDQAALQGFDRVWIDKDIWNTMSEEDQARLLIHEAFMGLKILRFANGCRLLNAAYLTNKVCANEQDFEFSISLKPDDYLEVQKATIQTFSQYSQMKNKDWVEMLNQNRIKFTYDWFTETKSMSTAEFGNLLLKATISNYLPTLGFNLKSIDGKKFANQQEAYLYVQSLKETCNVAASVTGQALSLNLSAATEKLSLDIPLQAEMTFVLDDVFQENRIIQRFGISYVSPEPRLTGGYTFYNIWLGFDSYRLAQVSVQEMVCADKDCYDSPNVDVKGGMLYVCSDNSNLFKP